ncbi:antitermination protein NusG [Candidatus Williamhamiltonella defendens]|uniref:NusG-type transcription antiterminator n=1 Tax=Hamiltonella defensa subsp. Acyrthosiphon pisum (strain 5AT) TaxID=572265 RepID=C4K668_HAMD5|nr:transcription termination/antitermination NusG family protein [Candidatus Hamiltonella defensa]ACQ68061.1 putative NusG-type transcription antiterminator [Candidatus Hamiltonella defensa 5AT (Acyrthosiphon pisum)]ATW22673.1 antitermination protein NusG [Candidatus Hamiltonella defensa]
MEKKWYLTCHKSGCSNLYKAQQALIQIEVHSLSPSIQTWRQRLDRKNKRAVIEPLFKGYLFTCFDPEKIPTRKIEHCAGISHLVRFANTIVPIREAVMQEIMRFPLCMNDETRTNHKITTSLKESQKEQIKNIVQKKEAHARTALFLAFLEAIQ